MATPTSTPLGHRGERDMQSTVTSAMSTTLTWPKPIVLSTGSSSSATGRSTAIEPLGKPSGRRTVHSVNAIVAMVISVITTLDAAIGMGTSGESTMAANGG